MIYTEGDNKITLENALPMDDEVGKKLSDPGQIFDFTVEINIKGNHNIAYEVTAEKDEASTLTNNDVRIYLEKSTNPNGPYKEISGPSGYIPMIQDDDFGAKTGEMRLDVGSTTTSVIYYYKLRMWLNKDYELTDEAKYFTIRINVYGKDTSINYEDGVTLDKTNATLKIGEKVQLNETITPATASDKRVVWTTSNENIVRVDSTGLVTAVKEGTAIVTVTTVNGKTATATITVEKPEATDIILDISEVNLITGGSTTVTAKVEPENASNPNLTWTSDNPNVVTVDASGKITAVGAGTTKIKVTTSNGIEKEIIVVVQDPEAEGVSIDNTTVTMITGDTITLTATITPPNSRDKTLTWTSSAESIVTVNNGVLTAIAPGTVEITVTTANGKTAKATITVQDPEVSKITLSGNVTIEIGATHQFIVTIEPENARDKTLIWTSSNKAVAEVDENGLVTGVGEGESTITETTVNGLTASVTVTVEKSTGAGGLIIKSNPPETIYPNGDPTEMYVFSHPATSQTPALTDYRYLGKNPSNWIRFNDELWRIIGVFKVDDGTGKYQWRLKIVRQTPIGNLNWATNGSSDWTVSPLMNLLNNGDYYNKTGSYAANGLSSGANELIANAKWYLGQESYAYADGNSSYSTERSNTNRYSHPYWVGKIGLMYLSDHLIPTDTVEDAFGWFLCPTNFFYWTITTIDAGGWSYGYGFTHNPTNSSGYSHHPTNSSILSNVLPVVYLNSDVSIIGGDGTVSSPYQVSL